MKARVKWPAVLLVSMRLAGPVAAATINEYLFDDYEATQTWGLVHNEVTNGFNLANPFNMYRATGLTNLHVAGGPFSQSFGMMHNPTNGGGWAAASYYLQNGVSGMTNITLETWINPIAQPDQNYVLNFEGAALVLNPVAGGFRALGLVYATGPAEYRSAYSAGSTLITPGTWWHIAMTYDGTTIREYLNGVCESSNAYGAVKGLGNAGFDGFWIGCYSYGTYPYYGSLDEIRMSDEALPRGDGSGSNCLAWNRTLVVSNAPQESYANGTNINLAVMDGAVASAAYDMVANASYGGPAGPQYQTVEQVSYLEGSVSPGALITPANPAWWKLALPGIYHVSHYDLLWATFEAPQYVTTDFKVQTSMDGSNWIDRATVIGNTSRTNSGDFADVLAKHIRVYITAAAGAGGQYVGLGAVRFSGENGSELDRRVSVAQSTWAGATIAGVAWSQVGGAITDYRGLGYTEASISSATPSFYPLVVTLRGAFKVDRVGLGQYSDYYHTGTRDVDVYTSPDINGTNWTLVKQIRDMPETQRYVGVAHPYSQYALGATVTARRVKFDILRNWEDPVTYNYTRIGQLYVFPVPPPPPAGTILWVR